jgi:hypothetical protein
MAEFVLEANLAQAKMSKANQLYTLGDGMRRVY